MRKYATDTYKHTHTHTLGAFPLSTEGTLGISRWCEGLQEQPPH